MPSNRIINCPKVENNPTEPVTLAEAKAQLIIGFSDDDAFITALITQCRQAIEEYCAISIVPKQITLTADLYKEWELPYGPVTGIVSVQTRIGNEGSGPGTYQTQESGWSTDGSQFLNFSPAAPVGFNPGVPFTGHDQWGDYASPYGNACNRYRIVYNAGYDVVPGNLKLAILQELVFRYENRGNQQTGVCEAAQVIANPFRRGLWF